MTITDPYTLCQNAWMDAVRSLTAFFPKPAQVSTNHTDLNEGAECWFFCTPGAFPNTRYDGSDKAYSWQIDCDLYVRYREEKKSIPRFMEVRGAIIKLTDRPRLIRNLNVNKVTLATSNKLQQDIPGTNPNFLIQAMVCTIEQIVKRSLT